MALAKGLPLTPWIFINNCINDSKTFANALASLIPQSCVCTYLGPMTSIHERLAFHDVCIWAHSSTLVSEAADIGRRCQIRAQEQGRNMAFVAICDNNTTVEYSEGLKKRWPENHTFINVEGIPVKVVGERIVRWLFTVLSVRETLHLIPKSEMLAINTSSYPDYEYCTLSEARMHRKDTKLQFVVLIASKPEVTKPKELRWKVVDRSGEEIFFFHHRGPASQQTWDWLLSLKVGERKVHPRRPMFVPHEPVTKTIALSPLRAAGTTIRGVGRVTMSMGMGMHWVGNKLTMRRPLESEEDRRKQEQELVRRRKDALMRKQERKEHKQKNMGTWVRAIRTAKYVANENKVEPKGSDCKILNEKAETTWKKVADDDASSAVAGSLLDEKVEKEFC